eukprot:gb/GECG01014599.1/.p1 GENE.gb/GECG01014599.1/~~gb/GECG01014599.1/.p1  ORF type:complete len:250 (+),score=50.35 gb/GECG01014599.1/:1-750(+)
MSSSSAVGTDQRPQQARHAQSTDTSLVSLEALDSDAMPAKSVGSFVQAVLKRIVYRKPESELPLHLILELLDPLFEDSQSSDAYQEKVQVFKTVAQVLVLAGSEKWDVNELDNFLNKTLHAGEKARKEFTKVYNKERGDILRCLVDTTKQTDELQNVAWQVDVVAASRDANTTDSTGEAEEGQGEAAGHLATDPRVKVQLQMNNAQTGEDKAFEMEIDGDHMQQLLAVCEEVERSIASHNMSSKSQVSL